MTCREFVDLLCEYLAGELSAEQREAYRRHLEECVNCAEYLRSYEFTIQLEKCSCKDLDGPCPDDIPEELVKAILAARSDQDRNQHPKAT